MINQIHVSNYNHVGQLTMNGFELQSSYNNNYFTDENGNVIYEHCNDDNYFEYWQIHSVNSINEYGNPNCEETYLGAIYSNVGIFEPEYSDLDENGIANVDTNCN